MYNSESSDADAKDTVDKSLMVRGAAVQKAPSEGPATACDYSEQHPMQVVQSSYRQQAQCGGRFVVIHARERLHSNGKLTRIRTQLACVDTSRIQVRNLSIALLADEKYRCGSHITRHRACQHFDACARSTFSCRHVSRNAARLS